MDISTRMGQAKELKLTTEDNATNPTHLEGQSV